MIKGTSVAPSTLGGAGFTGCDALDAAGVARIAGLNQLVTTFPSPLAADRGRLGRRCLPDSTLSTTSGNVWGEGDILLGGAGSDSINGRGANDIIDGDRFVQVKISVRTDPLDPATEIGSTDLMEGKALTGNFGPGTAGMTLQQAVFAGLGRPGQPGGDAGDHHTPQLRQTAAAQRPAVNCDIAVFNGPRASFTDHR